MIESLVGGTSFYTAPTHPGTIGSVVYSIAPRSGMPAARNAMPDGSNTVAAESGAAHPIPRAPTPIPQPESEIPQHQRWMASLAGQRDMQSREPSFTSGDASYGFCLKTVKEADDKAWAEKSANLITCAAARRP